MKVVAGSAKVCGEELKVIFLVVTLGAYSNAGRRLGLSSQGIACSLGML
jgi:hypothetical protein